jgi:hypothetical protein
MTRRYLIEATSFLLYSVKSSAYVKYIPITFMLFMVYLTMLSIGRSIHCRMARLSVTNKLERTWKKAFFQNSPGKTERTLRKMCQNSRCRGLDKNRTAPEYKANFSASSSLLGVSAIGIDLQRYIFYLSVRHVSTDPEVQGSIPGATKFSEK